VEEAAERAVQPVIDEPRLSIGGQARGEGKAFVGRDGTIQGLDGPGSISALGNHGAERAAQIRAHPALEIARRRVTRTAQDLAGIRERHLADRIEEDRLGRGCARQGRGRLPIDQPRHPAGAGMRPVQRPARMERFKVRDGPQKQARTQAF